MGLVSLGLLRRALGAIGRNRSADPPRGFLLGFLDGPNAAAHAEILAGAGAGVRALDLTPGSAPGEPRVILVLGPDREALREAWRRATGC